MCTKIVHPFFPIKDENSEILILGSFPSVISREVSFYYGNKKNRFWNIMKELYLDDFPSMNNEEKKKCLLSHHIAIYDVVYSCTIIGSSDSKISDVIYSDISEILKDTKIKRIFCNGKKAYSLFLKAYPEYKDITLSLPSTSPANAAWNMERLLGEWKIIKN